MNLFARARNTALGHVATVAGYARGSYRPQVEPASLPFGATVEDRQLGAIRIDGRLSRPDARSLVIIVHGMGGQVTSAYAVRAAHAAVDAGHAALRIHLRGAGGDGADLYHAGLGDDLAQLTRAPELARYERIAILGYSLGGHIALRHAADGPHDPRLVGVAAVCPPIDLDRGTIAIQRFDRRPYQEFVLKSLRQQLGEVRARHPKLVPAIDPAAIRTIRDWDEHVICPRFGFESLASFYRDHTIGPRLAAIEVPTLLVVAERDPMIAFTTVEPWIGSASDAVTVVRKQRGGHVYFPNDVGLLALRGGPMEDEIIGWLGARTLRAVGAASGSPASR
jgi:predicted alpha/beta-fold hydrolase